MEKKKKKGIRVRLPILILFILCSVYTVRGLFFASPDVGHFKNRTGQETYRLYYYNVLLR